MCICHLPGLLISRRLVTSKAHKMFRVVWNRLYEAIETIEAYVEHDEILSKFEIYNLNDENVYYVIVYLISAILIFLLCVLNNFYQSKKVLHKS